jgi:hypothetical protein
VAIVQEAYVHRVSTRRVDDLIKAFGIAGIGKSQVSRLCQALDQEGERFCTRPLVGRCPYILSREPQQRTVIRFRDECSRIADIGIELSCLEGTIPHIRYPAVITESVDELVTLERARRGQRSQPRVTMLRLLKSGQVRSLVAVAPMLGYSVRTVNTWWKRYQTGGLSSLVEQRPRPGKPSQGTATAWTDLEVAMTRGEIATLMDAQQLLAEQHGIHARL